MAVSTVLDVPFTIRDEAPYRLQCAVAYTPSTLFGSGAVRVFGSGPMQTLRLQPTASEKGVAEIEISATDEWNVTSTQRIRVTVGTTTSVNDAAETGSAVRLSGDGSTVHIDNSDHGTWPVECEVYSASSSALILREAFSGPHTKTEFSLPVGNLATGVYVLCIRRGSAVSVQKFVIYR
jgi:hypothetical protein